VKLITAQRGAKYLPISSLTEKELRNPRSIAVAKMRAVEAQYENIGELRLPSHPWAPAVQMALGV
jgi:hypothetical protein